MIRFGAMLVVALRRAATPAAAALRSAPMGAMSFTRNPPVRTNMLVRFADEGESPLVRLDPLSRAGFAARLRARRANATSELAGRHRSGDRNVWAGGRLVLAGAVRQAMGQ